MKFFKTLLCVLLLLSVKGCNWLTATPSPTELAIIVNQADPLSVKIGDYYLKKRNIAPLYLIKVIFDPNITSLSPKEFQRIKREVDGLTPPDVQGYALTWASPYRVGCMSMTSAFAFGFDRSLCAEGCAPTKVNPYFDSKSSQPYTDFGIRPTMAIAASNFAQAKALIDRGVASDNTYPKGTAYLMETNDKKRNVRSGFYPSIQNYFKRRFAIEVIKSNILQDQKDVMFYFTGLAKVGKIETNQFLPGAIADHLTSFGGKLTDSSQMSSLRWLEAGATGSYGTVVEPCNFPQKFPHPGIVMSHYLDGDTLLNAYWKSVAWIGQGIFVGEPLARPFAPKKP